MLTFLLVVHALITAILVVVILMQRSEGGGLGMGGSPTGLMSARGAADFLTRATTILATLFVALSIATAVVASRSGAPGKVDTSLQRTAAPGDVGTAPATAPGTDPLAAVAGQIGNAAAPVTTPSGPALLPATKSNSTTTGPGERGTTSTPARPAPSRAAPNSAPPPVAPTLLPSIAPKASPAPAPAGPASNAN